MEKPHLHVTHKTILIIGVIFLYPYAILEPFQKVRSILSDRVFQLCLHHSEIIPSRKSRYHSPVSQGSQKCLSYMYVHVFQIIPEC